MNLEGRLSEELARLKKDHLERRAPVFPSTGAHLLIDGKSFINFSSNDYLDLANHEHVKARAREALDTYGAGSTASRLVCGTLPIHLELEERLAAFKGYPSSLVFGSGFLANHALVNSFAGRGDHIFADRLAHASLIDASQASSAAFHRFQHNDPGHLESLLEKHAGQGRLLVVTESVFSMDGDRAPLEDLAGVCANHGAILLVDEAHATGLFGPCGSGMTAELGLQDQVALSMGTLSKALGGYGGFAACSEVMKKWLIHKGRSYIYTTAPPPAIVGAALGALDVLEREPDRGKTTLLKADRFRKKLQEFGLDTMDSSTPIVPVLSGSSENALSFSAALKAEGLMAVAIRPPTVPQGKARIRFTISFAHTDEELDHAAETIQNCAVQTGITTA